MATPTPRTSRARARGPAGGGTAGFTLVECMIAMAVLCVSVLAIAGALQAAYQNAASQGQATEAVGLARQLLEEIAARPFAVPAGAADHPGWPHPDRAAYDSIDDYDGYTDESGTLRTADGRTIAVGTAGRYARAVTVTPGVRPADGGTGPAGDFALVTVTVTRRDGTAVRLSQLFTRVTLVR